MGFTSCFLLLLCGAQGPGILGKERGTDAEKGNKLRKAKIKHKQARLFPLPDYFETKSLERNF